LRAQYCLCFHPQTRVPRLMLTRERGTTVTAAIHAPGCTRPPPYPDRLRRRGRSCSQKWLSLLLGCLGRGRRGVTDVGCCLSRRIFRSRAVGSASRKFVSMPSPWSIVYGDADALREPLVLGIAGHDGAGAVGTRPAFRAGVLARRAQIRRRHIGLRYQCASVDA